MILDRPPTPAMSLKSSMNAPINFCIITIPNSPVFDAETEKNTRVKVFLTPAVAVFTCTWSMENLFFSPCCYIERQNTIFLFIRTSQPERFAQFQALCLALKSACEVFEILTKNNKISEPARRVYLTEINWFIDNFAREKLRRKCAHIKEQARLQNAMERNLFSNLRLVIILTECWKGRETKQSWASSEWERQRRSEARKAIFIFHWMKIQKNKQSEREGAWSEVKKSWMENKVQGQWKPIFFSLHI